MKVPRCLPIGRDVTRPGVTHWLGQNPPYPARPPHSPVCQQPSAPCFSFLFGGRGRGVLARKNVVPPQPFNPLEHTAPRSFPRCLPNSTSILRGLRPPKRLVTFAEPPRSVRRNACRGFSGRKVVSPHPLNPSAFRARDPASRKLGGGPHRRCQGRPSLLLDQQPAQESPGPGLPHSRKLPAPLPAGRSARVR